MPENIEWSTIENILGSVFQQKVYSESNLNNCKILAFSPDLHDCQHNASSYGDKRTPVHDSKQHKRNSDMIIETNIDCQSRCIVE